MRSSICVSPRFIWAWQVISEKWQAPYLQSMLKYILFFLILFAAEYCVAQDSLNPAPQDTMQVKTVKKPLLKKRIILKKESIHVSDTFQQVKFSGSPDTLVMNTIMYAQHPFYTFINPVKYSFTYKVWEGKESIFYSIIALLLFFALIRNGCRRYIQDLFKIFLRSTMNQRQVKEQLLQSPLPSLLLNIFFLLSTGMYLTLLLRYLKMALAINFWLLFFYSICGLVIIYTAKFISLKIVGWIFQVSEAVNAYIFIVFTTNKVIGMVLLPFMVLLAFTYGWMTVAGMNLSILTIAALFAYRYFLSYISVHRIVKINFFHFILYLLAFEIVPVLLINKLLFRILGETY